MLVGAYPFEDPDDPRNFRKTIDRILNVQYSIPDYVRVSVDCRHLLSRIFVANPAERITLPEVKKQPWFLKNLPKELIEGDKWNYKSEKDQPMQSEEETMKIIQEARTLGHGQKAGGPGAASEPDPDEEADLESEIDVSCDF